MKPANQNFSNLEKLIIAQMLNCKNLEARDNNDSLIKTFTSFEDAMIWMKDNPGHTLSGKS